MFFKIKKSCLEEQSKCSLNIAWMTKCLGCWADRTKSKRKANFIPSTLPKDAEGDLERYFWISASAISSLVKKESHPQDSSDVQGIQGLGLFQRRIGEGVSASLGAHPCGRWAKERCTSQALQRKNPKGFDGYPHSPCVQLLNTWLNNFL